MTVRDVQEIMETWAPPDTAWERDNVGLQCGRPDARVRRILVALDVTEEIVREARRKKADLIISHHPLLFKPLRTVIPANTTGRCIESLLRHRITLYSAHTNLDFASGGTSHALAETLGLRDVGFLHSPFALQKKIVTFVPASHVDAVARAMADAGGGKIGNYEDCSFRSAGTGTFRGNRESHPRIGRSGVVERVEEYRVEMIVPQRNVDAVVRALKRAHPYEEVAYDIYPCENPSKEHGMGVIGMLDRPIPLRSFLAIVKRSLDAKRLRWTGDPRRQIRKVAACGGSGSDLIDAAIQQGADVFITADVRYHSFHDVAGRMALIDAGHYETEAPVIGAVTRRLANELRRRNERVPVIAAASITNPVFFA
jgi:dinuclear metal center YbgI/SA1388 family protein